MHQINNLESDSTNRYLQRRGRGRGYVADPASSSLGLPAVALHSYASAFGRRPHRSAITAAITAAAAAAAATAIVGFSFALVFTAICRIRCHLQALLPKLLEGIVVLVAEITLFDAERLEEGNVLGWSIPWEHVCCQ